MKRFFHWLKIILIVTLLINGIEGAVVAQISQDQKQAMEALGRYIRGFSESEWFKEWNRDWNRIPENYQSYSFTISNGKVTELNLSSKNLTDRIQFPDSIKKLKYLEKLVLSYNQLSKFPMAITQLSGLKYLALNNNRLNGNVLEHLTEMTHLTELYLSNNKLSGGIPGTINHLIHLKVIDISRNQLSGNIPLELLELTHLSENRSDFRWNGLFVAGTSQRHQELRRLLTRIQKDKRWQHTQTVVPSYNTIEGIPEGRDTVRISWQRIHHIEQTDYYITLFQKNGSQREAKIIKWKGHRNKYRCYEDIHGLKPNTTYRYSIQSVTPSGQHNQSIVKSEKSPWKEVTTRGSTIFGKILIAKNGNMSGLPGVRVSATNRQGFVLTNEEGVYNLDIKSQQWKGILKASKPGYTFHQDQLTGRQQVDFPDGISGDREINFIAQLQTVVSGKITDLNGQPVSGVCVTFFDRQNKVMESVYSKPDGSYRYTVPPGWEGRIDASKGNYKIDPAFQPLGNVFEPKRSTNFIAHILTISGTISDRSGTPLPDIEVIFKNGKEKKSTVSGWDGKYSYIVTFDWQGIICPTHKKYRFHKKHIRFSHTAAAPRETKDSFDFRAEKKWRFFADLSGNVLSHAEPRFADIYSGGVLELEVTAGCNIFTPVYIWTGYSIFSSSGQSAFFNEPAKWTQEQISLGVGCRVNLSMILDVRVEAGMIYVMYQEEAFSQQKKGNAPGFRFNTAGIYKLNSLLYGKLNVSYLWARDTVAGLGIKLGGIKTGLGIGMRF